MTKRKDTPVERFNRERAAMVLVDAITLGDKTAAERHDISEKSVSRYRARLLIDPELSRIVQEKGREAEHGWHFARARFLRKTLQKLEEMVDAATPDHFEHVIAALKAAGELDLATQALGVGTSDHQPRPSPAEAPGEPDAEGEAGSPEDDEGAGAGASEDG